MLYRGRRAAEQAFLASLRRPARSLKRLIAPADGALRSRHEVGTRAGTSRGPRCRRLHHARAERRHGVTRSEANARQTQAASPLPRCVRWLGRRPRFYLGPVGVGALEYICACKASVRQATGSDMVQWSPGAATALAKVTSRIVTARVRLRAAAGCEAPPVRPAQRKFFRCLGVKRPVS